MPLKRFYLIDIFDLIDLIVFFQLIRYYAILLPFSARKKYLVSRFNCFFITIQASDTTNKWNFRAIMQFVFVFSSILYFRGEIY